MDKLAAYYAQRAAEYERIYAKPERQADLASLRVRIARLAAGRKVLELACGTGYWTQIMAGSAARVTAIDVNEEVLEIARAKSYPANRVEFIAGDCYAPPVAERGHDMVYAGFWWSHVPLARLDSFLEKLSHLVAPGAMIAFLDNSYVEGSSTPVSRRDAQGNSYQLRKLDDGSIYEVLKNFPDDAELLRRASAHGTEAKVENFKYFWLLSWRTPE